MPKYRNLRDDNYFYHYRDSSLVMTQVLWKEADQFKKVDPSWIPDTDIGCYPDRKPTKGNWHLTSNCHHPKKWGSSYWIQKEERVDEKLLLILPCNAGVIHANYFMGGNPKYNNMWKAFDLNHRDYRDQFCIAAVDCLIYCSDVERSKMPGYRDGLGSLVFEWEMERVRSEVDEGIPTVDAFVMNELQEYSSKKRRGHALAFVDYLETGLQRALDYGFEVIYAHLTPFVYRSAFIAAVERMQIWDKVFIPEFRNMVTGVSAQKIFHWWLRNGMTERGIYDPLYLHTAKKAKATIEVFPELQFWNLEQFHFNWEPEFWEVEYKGSGDIRKNILMEASELAALTNNEADCKWYNIPPNVERSNKPPKGQFGEHLTGKRYP